MKTLNETFTDTEFAKLKKRKPDGMCWHNAIVLAFKMLKGGVENE